MTTPIEALQERWKAAAEVRNVAVDFQDKLETSETLTGTPTVTASPAGPTISNKAVSSESLTINGDSVAAGKAVQFTVTGGTAATDYTLTVSCGTTATPAQTLVCTLVLHVV